MPNPPQRRASIVAASQQVTEFSGPLPPPDTLAKYDQVLPGLAERIVALAEKQSAHRQSLEVATVGGNIAAQACGQWLAFAIVLVGIVSGTVLIALDKPTAGLTALLTPLGTVATAFFVTRAQQASELARKRETQDQASRQPNVR